MARAMTNRRILISVILPTYNEAKNIPLMISEIDRVMLGAPFEIIVVDDDSPDGTSDVVSELKDEYACLRLITRTEFPGLVNSIWDGINASNGEICLWMDADLSMPTERIGALLKAIEQGADLAFGSRYIEGGRLKGADYKTGNQNLVQIWQNLRNTEDSFLAVAISKFGNLFARIVLDRRFHDYTSGFYAVKKPIILELGLQGNYLDYCIRLLYKASLSGVRIAEIPIAVTPRQHGQSKTAENAIGVIKLAVECIIVVISLKLFSRSKQVPLK